MNEDFNTFNNMTPPEAKAELAEKVEGYGDHVSKEGGIYYLTKKDSANPDKTVKVMLEERTKDDGTTELYEPDDTLTGTRVMRIGE